MKRYVSGRQIERRDINYKISGRQIERRDLNYKIIGRQIERRDINYCTMKVADRYREETSITW